ncbi:MAG TPA: UDP-2,3-diacylglucosamine diphosphatase, partial [Arenimonas sp.]|nr:UDP-2,3-diacylglucosamine diphosphatase [Arenimonas sp.]
MGTLFISDLHLDESRPEITGLFLDFLRNDAVKAEALYILGDLFEAWVGDDDNAELGIKVANALRELGDQ